MAKTMKAARVHNFGDPLVIEEVDVPEPGEGEILVNIQASGVCHTDLHAVEGDWPVKPKLPLTPGHEGVGFVAAVGKGVTNVKEGDRVGVPWLYTACGKCEYCVDGWETLCPNQQNAGYSVDGGYAEYSIADAAYVGRIPDHVGFLEAAPILCAGVTVYKGLKETEVKPGQWVSISGIGGLGHLAVQYAKAMGMNVVAVDVQDHALDLATKLGADMVINPMKTDPGEMVQKEIGGAHGALVTAVSTVAFRQALDMLRRKGVLSMNGLPPGDFDTPIFDVVLKRLTIRGSIVGTRNDLEESLWFANAGKVKANVEGRPMEEINEIFQLMRDGKINGRIVLDMSNRSN
jgi:alcohol dehydrogenase, propanol-preferring